MDFPWNQTIESLNAEAAPGGPIQAQSERKKAETELQAKQEQLQREQEVSWQLAAHTSQTMEGGTDKHVDFPMVIKFSWALEWDQKTGVEIYVAFFDGQNGTININVWTNCHISEMMVRIGVVIPNLISRSIYPDKLGKGHSTIDGIVMDRGSYIFRER